MPQFNGQNKKKIDPRYFSEELLEEVLDPERAVGPLDPEKNPEMGADIKWRRQQREKPAIKKLALQYYKLNKLDPKDPANGFAEYLKQLQIGGLAAARKAVERAAKAAAGSADYTDRPGAAGARRSKLYAKGPTAGKIQGLLLKAFGVMAESKILSEANIRSVLGSRKIDGKIGPTTLKSMQKIPAITGLVNTPSDLKDPENIKAILNALQKCAQGGFKDPKCKPRGQARPAASKAVAAAKTGDPAAIARALGGKEAAQALAQGTGQDIKAQLKAAYNAVLKDDSDENMKRYAALRKQAKAAAA